MLSASATELRAEREHLELARRHLDRLRSDVAGLSGQGADSSGTAAVTAALRRRRDELDQVRGPLAFGRVNYRSDSEHPDDSYAVGRIHVAADDRSPLVVDWRAEIARPFYTASAANPSGLRRRSRYQFDGEQLVGIANEELTDQTGELALEGTTEVQDPRSRDALMRDIVATIHHAQDALIRVPILTNLLVQGGPGTGKTAVGLHRAAYLLYQHRDRLERDGVLVVGPTEAYLAFIEGVLPGLGELAVTQTTPERLTGRRRGREHEPDAVRQLKGDARMADLLRRALDTYRRPVSGPLEIRFERQRLRLDATEIEATVQETRQRGTSWSNGRDLLRQRLAELLAQQVALSVAGGSDSRSYDRVVRWLRGQRLLGSVVDAAQPALRPEQVLDELLTRDDVLAKAGRGLLSDAEQRLLRRQPEDSTRWSLDDLVLLDELDGLLRQPRDRYGHVVVDEVQDLSPMQLRLIGRRAGGSVTVVGDLAQATSPYGSDDWGGIASHLGLSGVDIAELTVGFRLGQRNLDVANRLLPAVAPDLAPASSVRPGSAPELRRVTGLDLVSACVDTVRELQEGGGSVAVIVEEDSLAAMSRHLAAHAIPFRRPEDTRSSHQVCLTAPEAAKGLEFDHTIVVEPADIADRHERGLNLLYVALTRAVRRLVVLHVRDLPSLLTARSQQELPGAPTGERPAEAATSVPVRRREHRPRGPSGRPARLARPRRHHRATRSPAPAAATRLLLPTGPGHPATPPGCLPPAIDDSLNECGTVRRSGRCGPRPAPRPIAGHTRLPIWMGRGRRSPSRSELCGLRPTPRRGGVLNSSAGSCGRLGTPSSLTCATSAARTPAAARAGASRMTTSSRRAISSAASDVPRPPSAASPSHLPPRGSHQQLRFSGEGRPRCPSRS